MPEYPDSPLWRERAGWSTRWELNRWVKQWLALVPGGLGSFLRRRLYPFGGCGRDCLILEGFWAEYSERLIIGDHVGFNRDCFINAAGGVRIGDWSLLGLGSAIISQNHVLDGIAAPMSLAGDERAPVTVGRDVWIGARAVVLPGVTLGDGVVVGAGAVVTRDVEPYMVVGGVPARPLRARHRRGEVS